MVENTAAMFFVLREKRTTIRKGVMRERALLHCLSSIFMVPLFVFSACFHGHRRDSFITHRAFCDALAQESGRAITATNSLLHSHGIQAALPALKREQELNLAPEIQPWLAGPSPLNLSHLFSTNLAHHENPSPNSSKPDPTLPPFQPAASPHMSATALLQKAAQMGVTMSKPSPSPTTVSCLGLSSREEMGSGSHSLASFGNRAAVVTSSTGFIEQGVPAANSGSCGVHSQLLHDMMMRSLPSSTGFEGSSFEEDYHRMIMNPKREGDFQDALSKATESPFSKSNGGGGNDGLTRDFLGVGAFSHKDFLNMAGFDYMNPSSTYGQHNQNQPPWQG